MNDLFIHGGWPTIFSRLIDGSDLTSDEGRDVMAVVLAGEATDAQLAGLLLGLRGKGEAAAEMSGMVDAMLDAAAPLELTQHGVIDLVGTGGSPRRRTRALNVSTAASFVAAGAGAKVCKHGNRRASSTSGSSDVLDELGVAVELDGPQVAACVSQVGVAFAFAKMFHPAMRHAAGVRAELGIPTVFNLLGPLAHPAHLKRAVIGVSDPARLELLADVMVRRGVERVWLVHGEDGLDELSTSAPSQIVDVAGDRVERRTLNVGELGMDEVSADDIGGGDPAENARIIGEVLAGKPGPEADLIVLNAAAGLVVAGLHDDLGEALAAARHSIDTGAAERTLTDLRRVTAELTAS
ncbi:MAG: anthranilate phosphoribosyltransferase [Microthrixaceae bacterium]|nr:anthranilate phosphoribosyltransferase [Microthrixaceae bacterium]